MSFPSLYAGLNLGVWSGGGGGKDGEGEGGAKNHEKSPETRLVLMGINKSGDFDEIVQRLKSCAGPV